MIKKIYLIFFITLLFVSCGKKGDPVYKESNTKFFGTQNKIVS
tara:strand:+ start:671 stop:799 length:129 start_codon:yes stop_codon:yes gene_type:complete